MRRTAFVVVAAAWAVVGMGDLSAQRQATWIGDRFDVMEQSIPQLQDAMSLGTVTSRELVEIYLARIDAYDKHRPSLNAIITVNPRALDDAAALDRERATRGPRGPLHGIPVVIKDNYDVAGLPTSAGTLAFARLYPADDAFQVKKLRDAGAVILAKTNLHELAAGITTMSSLGGQTRNPYDPARNPGGSSGGTGAAVAANFAAAGFGSDTCGSIRIPASHNSLVGLRVSSGLSSRDGIVPLSHSQDVAGPLARSIADLAILLDATVAEDPADPTTKLGNGQRPRSYSDLLKPDALEAARIGVLTSLFGDAEDGAAAAVVRRSIDTMKSLGAEVVDVSVPGLDELLRGSSVIDAEFKFDLQDYLATIPSAPVHSLGEILDAGLYSSAIEASMKRRNAVPARETESYRRARIKRQAVRQAVTSTMEEQRLDALVYPTMRRTPALVGEPQSGSNCQLSASSGLPALSVPAGFTEGGLPIGLELLGRAFDESRLLAFGYALEAAGRIRRPPFSTPALVARRAPPPLESVANIPGAEPSTPLLTVRFRFDRTTGELRYQADAGSVAASAVLGAWIHRGREGQRGPALYQLLAAGERQRSSTIVLSPVDVALLLDRGLYLAMHTEDNLRRDDRVQLGPASPAGVSVPK